MTNEQLLNLIKKIIEKTKNHSLKWSYLRDNPSIMNSEPFDTLSIYNTVTPSCVDDIQKGYYANFKNGFIFLLPFENTNFISNFPAQSTMIKCPTENQKEIVLRVQPSKYAYFTKLADTNNSNSDINIQLKRLYTIVENSVSDVDSFIDDFLNS